MVRLVGSHPLAPTYIVCGKRVRLIAPLKAVGLLTNFVLEVGGVLHPIMRPECLLGRAATMKVK